MSIDLKTRWQVLCNVTPYDKAALTGIAFLMALTVMLFPARGSESKHRGVPEIGRVTSLPILAGDRKVHVRPVLAVKRQVRTDTVTVPADVLKSLRIDDDVFLQRHIHGRTKLTRHVTYGLPPELPLSIWWAALWATTAMALLWCAHGTFCSARNGNLDEDLQTHAALLIIVSLILTVPTMLLASSLTRWEAGAQLGLIRSPSKIDSFVVTSRGWLAVSYAFTTPEGQHQDALHIVERSDAKLPRDVAIGRPFDAVYVAGRPEHARPDWVEERAAKGRLTAVLALILGFGAIVASLLTCLAALRYKRPSPPLPPVGRFEGRRGRFGLRATPTLTRSE